MPLVVKRRLGASGIEKWGATLTAKGAGWKKLQSRLMKYQTDFALDWSENQATSIALNHLEFARELCPKDTGKLAESLYLTLDTTEFSLKRLTKNSNHYRFVSGDKSVSGGALSVASQFTGDKILDREGPLGGTYIRSRYYLTTDDPIAWHVEYGTSKMAARPFMRPAYSLAAEIYLSRLRRYTIQRARAGA